MTQPRWSWRKAWYWSGGVWYSGYIAKKGSGSTAQLGKYVDQSFVDDSASGFPASFASFFAGRNPPNQVLFATRFTPATDWILAP